MTNGAAWRVGTYLSVRWVGLQGLYGASPSDLAHAAASMLALMLSVFSLYLQRRDRRPRLEMSLLPISAKG